VLFHINTASGVPVYRQIIDQVKRAMASGALRPGDRLPPVRKLAEDHGINPNTVARAYQEMLEKEKILVSVPGGGTFVGDGKPELERRDLIERLRELAHQLAVEGQQMRLPREKILKIVEEQLKDFGL
jgi:GntR family transcriptional regulator